jgi:hypothetical protein
MQNLAFGKRIPLPVRHSAASEYKSDTLTKLLRSAKPCPSKIELWRIRHAKAGPFCADIFPLKAETGVRFLGSASKIKDLAAILPTQILASSSFLQFVSGR